MPYLNSENKPSFLNGSDSQMPQKGINKGLVFSRPIPAKEDKSLFRGRSQISKYEFERTLDKNKELRKELAKELRERNPYSEKVNQAIREIKAKIPATYGSYIDQEEAKRLWRREYWEKKHKMEQEREGGVTLQEIKQRKIEEKKIGFFKRLFGIDKK
jgi:uncharacterized protein YhaN